MRRSFPLFLFFLSGISGLIYEIAWVRQASLTFWRQRFTLTAPCWLLTWAAWPLGSLLSGAMG